MNGVPIEISCCPVKSRNMPDVSDKVTRCVGVITSNVSDKVTRRVGVITSNVLNRIKQHKGAIIQP